MLDRVSGNAALYGGTLFIHLYSSFIYLYMKFLLDRVSGNAALYGGTLFIHLYSLY